MVGREIAARMAEAGNSLLEKLQSADATIRRQEAELAAQATPGLPPSLSRELSKKLQAALKDGVTAARCAAAGLYLLDDQTANLKLRARYGIPTERLQAPPRPLRGAMADLEALVSGLAVVERLTDNPQWTSPEPWESGMCASVLVDETPIGTLWMWRGRAGKYSKGARAAIRITADRLGLLLQQALAKQSLRAAQKMKSTIRAGVKWQQASLPVCAELAPNWRAAGWVDRGNSLSAAWYHWDILPDGMIALAVGQGINLGGTADALTAVSLRAAWQAHSGYRHSPSQVIRRVSDTLWQTSNEPINGSLLYAKINPDTGEADIAWAGDLPVFIVSRFGYRAVCQPSGFFGSSPDLHPATAHAKMELGDCFAVVGPALMATSNTKNFGQLAQQELVAIACEHLQTGPKDILSAVRRVTATRRSICAGRSLVLLQRSPNKDRSTSKRKTTEPKK